MRMPHSGLTPLLHTVGRDADRADHHGEELGPLLDAARVEGRCAVDTEFVWERTYAPALCLVQIATAERLAVVDPLEGAPLEPVAELMADAAVEKVMHAPSGDLAAFVLHHDVRPQRVYDTQLAAGFAGYGGSLSLERLLEASVRVHLRHDEGFTDWQRRPLTPTQIEYAADDVRYLLAAADALTQAARIAGPARRGSPRSSRPATAPRRRSCRIPRRPGAASPVAGRCGPRAWPPSARRPRGASARPAGATCRPRGW